MRHKHPKQVLRTLPPGAWGWRYSPAFEDDMSTLNKIIVAAILITLGFCLTYYCEISPIDSFFMGMIFGVVVTTILAIYDE